MEDLRDRIDEVVSRLRTARARDAAGALLEVVFAVLKKEGAKGHVRVTFRGDGHDAFALSTDSVKAVDRDEKPGRLPVLLDLSVDRERFEKSVEKARTIQELAFKSGMRIRGRSTFIVSVSRALNKVYFRVPAGEN
jgi:hypothetical protein